jgi:hypothetical protein
VWFGNSGSERPEFGLVHLARIVPVLEELHRSLPVHLTVVSDSRRLYDQHVARASIPTSYRAWRRSRVAAQLARGDVCILPIVANPYTVCKTNNRLWTAFLVGLPVVASPIPSYEEFGDWVLFEDWGRSITSYAEDPDLARRHVEGARAHIERTYTPQHLVDQWSAAIRTACG